MPKYRLAPRAEKDLVDIWNYTASQWSENQAGSYYDDIMDAIERLADGSSKGRPVTVRTGYEKYAVGQHFVFFQKADIGITVIRILHQRMDVERHL
ncbi:type II toxin-antitoxin system RelE/ParE family toxin [Cognatiyoonia sp. IB215182]|uniref:type II toxin-antitoxin system RelE/ParE family toxin n=1 Tax=Cognatiyoonia sp. IB215182 TaxID=3097353 RepID=UPI002A152323|nr:type II toxin-antitoxin system RelE/ParE family toxin [Cognatiyoonia sp. IB215182]MDX8355674.1 type II toxin-antitoxin system RelE/ParE family toxin [Cognatiyoonia sp. IB215182]